MPEMLGRKDINRSESNNRGSSNGKNTRDIIGRKNNCSSKTHSSTREKWNIGDAAKSMEKTGMVSEPSHEKQTTIPKPHV
jgi:hypothetical protein